MTIANVKGLVAKFLVTGLVATAFTIAGTAKADAQQFGVAVQFGHPAYVSNYDGYGQYSDGYGQYRDGYRVDRNDYRRDGYRVDDYRRQEEFRQRQERAEYLRRQEYIRHEQREQWERYHGDDRPYGYR